MDNFNEGMILASLIKQLKKILQSYPDDGQILKEVIQNAEDAGASKVVFLIDNTTYGTDPTKLYHEGLAQYQGPALYAYNDAVFRDDDWKGIRMLDDSVKADDPMKVGRFGLGFKSVFHMTDLPSVLSGKGVGFIDPHREFFEVQLPGWRSRERTTSFLWHLERDREEIARLKHQFEPFIQQIFGVTESTLATGNFKGTIFRFPFRTKQMKSSDLSNTTYDRDKVKDLVRSLRADAHHMLLFLRHLNSIEVFEKDSGGEVKKLMDIRNIPPYLDLVRRECMEFQRQIKVDWRRQEAVSATYPLAVTVEDYTGGNPVVETYVWLVSQYYAGAEHSRFVKLTNDKGYLPLVGVALPLDVSIKEPLCKSEPKGHVFCFLPLPLEKKSPTGLRFHVHGSFAIDQNRRHLKWPSADLEMLTLRDDALIWNKFLVKFVLPEAALKMIAYLTTMHGSRQSPVVPKELTKALQDASLRNPEFTAHLVYAMIPDAACVTTQWKGLSDAIYDKVWNLSIFYSRVSGGKWLHCNDAIFDCMDNQSSLNVLLRSILNTDQRNLVSIPQYIDIKLPNGAIRIAAESVCQSLRNVQYTLNLGDQDRMVLLSYIMEHPNHVQNLLGLNLLPLKDGSWTEFKMANWTERVYVDSTDHPQKLLPGMERRFLKTETVPKNVKGLASTGAFQLRNLNAHDVLENLRTIFSRWQTLETIPVNQEPWLTDRWLAELWSYLQKNFSAVDGFENMHILPLGQGVIGKLNRSLPIVSKTDGYNRGGTPLHAELVSLCKQVGVKVIENIEPEVFKHPGVWNTYILQPNARGLLVALRRQECRIGMHKLVELFRKVSSTGKQRFRELVANLIQSCGLAVDDGYLLKSLPMFFTVNGSGGKNTYFVSLAELQRVGPTANDIPLPSPEALLDLTDKDSRKIAGSLGITPPSIPDHLVDVYFPAACNNSLSKDSFVKLMQYVCRNLSNFQQISSRIILSAREMRFISRSSGELVRPCDVYDKSELLRKLFDEEDVFPWGEFAKQEYNQALLKLGLKKADSVTAGEILAIAEKLSTSTKPSQAKLNQAEALMSFLNQYGDRILSQCFMLNRISIALKTKLSELRWVKISSTKPQNYPSGLAFVGEHSANSLARPTEIFASKFVYLVGSSRATVDIQGFASLAKHFDWTTEPPVRYVAEHLLNTILSYDPKQKVAVQYILVNVYRHMNKNHGLAQTVVDVIGEQPWVWHGDGFARINQMVLSKQLTLDLKPYIYPLTVEMVEFRDLWSYCGMENTCNLVQVLLAIKQAHDFESDLRNKERDIQLAVNILNEIAKNRIDEELRNKIVIPISTENNKLEMKGIDECTYCDKEWYHHGFSVEDLDDDIFLIHELVPLATAEKLNIPSLINKTIGAEELALGYGQSEPLTTRLKTILRDYTDGLAVLKELIQNADDAGANEIRFLYDERRNEDAQTILLDKGMKTLQGPALWTYNDAVFTDEDFESIVKLSGATKETATEKIGRFGLGFNAVYNLTDVPLFISRKFIAIFDPHTTHLGRAIPDKTKPGMKLNLLQNRRKIQRLVDQFKPMNGIFGVDLSSDSNMESYNGTLFRFPLRTREQAGKSKICNICYDREEMVKLLELLHDAGHHLLMYTQNVRKITVCHLPESGSPPGGIQEWFTVKKELVKAIRNIGRSNADVSPIEAQCAVLQKATNILTNYKNSPTREIPKLESSSVLKFTTIRGSKVPFSSNDKSEVSEWLVVSALGRDRSFALALKDKTLIPLGGVAARLRAAKGPHYEAVDAKSVGDVAFLFCFLPLPIKTSFPVHINGFFAVHSSRTHLYETSPMDKTDRRAVWNEALLDDAVTRAYCILLEDLTRLCPGSDSYVVWPSHSTLKEIGFLGRLTESVYKRVCSMEDCMPVIKTVESWTTIGKCRMLSRQFWSDQLGKVALSAFRTVLKNEDTYAVDIPEKILETIRQTSCGSVVEDRTISKVDFYTEWFLPNIGIDPLERDKLILHALEDEAIARHLKDVDCIPVTPDGKELRSIEELIHPNSQLTALFDKDEGRFPMWTSGVTVEDKTYERLVSLGMRQNGLPWLEIVDRCVVISSNPKTAASRTPIILSLMDKQLKLKTEKISSVEKVFAKIRKAKFLPVMKKPKNFPLKWKGEEFSDHQLISCEQGFLQNQKNLVCCSCPVIDEKLSFDNSCHQTKQNLSLDSPTLDPNVVVQQALEVVRVGKEKENNRNLSAEDLRILNEVYDAAFKWLDTFLKENDTYKSTVKLLASQNSIMLQSDKHTNYFLEPERCAMTFPLGNDTLLPYLAAIPPAMVRSYPVLLKAIGVREVFSLSDYVRILQEIKAQSEEGGLDKRKLDVSIYLITVCIYEEVKNPFGGENAELLSDMPMPNAECVMCIAKELCFNNCLWLVDAAAERSKFCHDRIPHEIASVLGLQTIRQGVLKCHRLGIPYGQKEPLVKRIKKILKGYPFSEDILKEMLQNADDSGATEVHFIRDTRNLPSNKIFEDSWKPLQGPALCVYNNKSFKKTDLEGIQNLGEGGKSDDPTKTGQYGVGFNCVYHVTDVPTFLTTVESRGTVLCAFDPNCKFVPEAQAVEPGAMYKDVESLKKNFPDVFKGYLLDQKKYDVSQTGTLFRLPLRNTEMANESQISKKTVSVKDVAEMFEKFKTDMSEALLFVNSVEEMSLVDVTEGKNGTESVTVVYNVSIHMTKEARKLRAGFHKYIVNAATKLVEKKVSLKDVAMKEVSYQMEIKDSENNADVWQIVHRFGFEDIYNLPVEIVKEVSMGNLGLLPRGGVAYLVKTNRKMEMKSRLFCFLPLPVPVELPVHLNGHFALDHENRRDLWKDENKTYRAEWNRCLMEGVIAPTYCTLLSIIRDHIRQLDSYDEARSEMEKYFNTFPRVNKGDNPYINKMSEAVYKYIMTRNLEVLPLQSMKRNIKAVEWKNPRGEPDHNVFFDHLESQLPEPPSTQNELFRSSGVIKQEAANLSKETKSSVVRKLLGRCGFSMFSCPVRIFKSFEKAGTEISIVSPESVLDFFATHNKTPTRCKVTNLPQCLSHTPFKDVASLVALLEYVTKAKSYKERLEGLPFLLTCDCFVRSFDSNQPSYLSWYSQIAPHIPQRFMNLEICSALKLNPNTDRNLCVEFTVDEFAKVLPDLIPAAEFYNSEGCYPVESLSCFLHSYTNTTQQWLVMIWSFLQSNLFGKSPEHDKTTISELISPLSNCCLLPVLASEVEMLYPFCRSFGVIPLQMFVDMTHKEVATILHKLGVAEPNYKYIRTNPVTTEIMRLTGALFGTVQQPASVVEALKFLLKSKSLEGKLKNEECHRLLSYFSSNVGNLKIVPDIKQTVKKLPIFITLYKKQISLEESKAYVLPSEIPQDDMEILTARQNIIFLKEDYNLKPLFEYLDCEYLTVEQLYCTFILKDFQSLSTLGQQAHMSCVKSHIQRLKITTKKENIDELNRFLERLKCLAFIPKNGITGLFPPSDFYSPENEVFQIMQETNKFPPEPYNRPDWLSILKQCGLVQDLTTAMFISYAQRVERDSDGSNNQELLLQQSNKLVKHLLTWDETTKMEFANAVKAIRFVVPGLVDNNLGHLHSQFGEGNHNGVIKFIAFHEAVVYTHHELVWTVQNLLPRWIGTSESNQKALKALGVVVVPELKTVALHVENLCTKYKQESNNNKKVKVNAFQEVLQKIYEFLSKMLPLAEPEKTILARTPLVFIRDTYTLVRPTQIAIDIKSREDIKPYLYKIPLDFGSFASLFQQLGATKELTAEQFALVLREIADVSQGERLNFNDKNACCKATEGLLKLIAKKQTVTGDIFLPCTDDKLHRSTEVLFCDNEQLLHRIEHFSEPTLIDAGYIGLLRYDLEQILKLLPPAQCTKFVSEIVREVIVESQTVSCAFAEKMASRLRNSVFRSGCERIFRHCLTAPDKHGKIVNLDQRCIELKGILDEFSFVGKHRVQTFLMYNEQQIRGSEKQHPYFCESNTKFHIQSSEVINEHDFCETVAKAINKAAGDVFKNHMLDLSGTLWRPTNEIHSYLNRFGIRESADRRSLFIPPLGSFVRENDQHLLVQDNFIFHNGQLLALEKDDPFDRGEGGNPVFILVEFVERLEPTDPSAPIFSARYKIKVNDDEEIIVEPADLYVFSRVIGSPTDTQKAVVVFARSESTEEGGDQEATDTSLPRATGTSPTHGTQTLEQIVEEIKKILKEAWTQSQEVRDKVRKRLYLRWHPDKNPDQVDLCTEVCKVIQHLIERLKKGLSMEDYKVSKDSSTAPSSGTNPSTPDFDDYFDRMRERAKSYRSQQENYYKRRSSSRRSSGSYRSHNDYEDFFRGFTQQPNPQPEEARRWMRQAKHNLQSSLNDGSVTAHPSYDWMCIKCYEAAKIAIRAVKYARDANTVAGLADNLTSLSFGLNDSELSRLVSQMEVLVISLDRLKYPSGMNIPKIPGEVYSEDTATEAYNVCNKIVDRCSHLISSSNE